MAIKTSRYNAALLSQPQQDLARKQQEAQQEVLKQREAQQEGSDLGGILGLIGAGLGAAAIIGTGGIAAAPVMALGAIGGAATVGGGLGSAVGKQAVKMGQSSVEMPQDTGVNKGQLELSQMAAMKSRSLPTLSDQTKVMARSLQSLGRMPQEIQDEYKDVLLKGITKSFGQDILKARGVV
ncbi:MAG: hypothetical protein KA413_00310 [Candidatus Methylopumilus sp.]|nr:hypothetical protein [Candidatus Methylopumilus sp.]